MTDGLTKREALVAECLLRISNRPPAERKEIEEMAQALRDAINAGGNSARLAMALVGAELSVEAERHLGAERCRELDA